MRKSFPSIFSWGGEFCRILAAAAVLTVVLSFSGLSRADSCSSFISLTPTDPQITCTMPQSSQQQTMTVGLKNISFTSQAQGVVLIYSDSTHTVLSDMVTFMNVNGVATAIFVSDLNGASGVPPSLPVIGSYTESKGYILVSLALTNGKVLHVGICDDNGAGCNTTGNALRFSVGNASVPEPATLFLLGSGVMGCGVWGFATGALRRRRDLTKS